MLFGTVTRHVVIERNTEARRLLPGLAAFLLLGIVVIGLVGYDATNMPERPRADFLGVFLGIGIFLSSWTMRPWLSHPAMQWLGAVSYSLYLLHSPCVALFSGIAARIDAPAVKLAILGMSFAISLVAAHLTYRWIERPMIALGKRLANRPPQPRAVDT